MGHRRRLRLLQLQGNLLLLLGHVAGAVHLRLLVLLVLLMLLVLLLLMGVLVRLLRHRGLLLRLRHHHALLRGHGLVRLGRMLGVRRLLGLRLHRGVVGLVRLVVHVRRQVLRGRLRVDAPVLIMLRRRGDGGGRVGLRRVVR